MEKNVKEFENDFTIAFSYAGKEYRAFVPLSKILRNGKWWRYQFPLNESRTAVLFGTIDGDKNIRTTGPCVTREGAVQPATFGIEIYHLRSNKVEYIDDVDIVATDSQLSERGIVAEQLRKDFGTFSSHPEDVEQLTALMLDEVMCELSSFSDATSKDIHNAITIVLKRKLAKV